MASRTRTLVRMAVLTLAYVTVTVPSGGVANKNPVRPF